MSSAPIYAKATPDTGRGLTAALWRGALRTYLDGNPEYGTRIYDDFVQPRANATDASANNGWFIQDAAAGGTNEAFTSIASPDGVAQLSASTGTDHFGIEAHLGESATTAGMINLPTATTDPRGNVIVEFRVNLTDQKSFFIGLTEPIVEFLSSTSTLPTDSDYAGFFRSDGGALKLVCANDNDGGTAVTDEYELLTAAEMDALEDASDNWFRLAVRFNKDGSVESAVNGTWYSADKMGILETALPEEALTLKLALTRGATDDQATVELPIDRYDVFIEPV